MAFQRLADGGDDQAAATRITDLETAWDADQSTIQPASCQAWAFVDGQVDDVLSAVRTSSPDRTTEDRAMTSLLTTLG